MEFFFFVMLLIQRFILEVGDIKNILLEKGIMGIMYVLKDFVLKVVLIQINLILVVVCKIMIFVYYLIYGIVCIY